MRLQVFLKPVFAVCAADARFSPPGVESLDYFKAFTVYLRFAKFQFIAGAHHRIHIGSENGGSQAVLVVFASSIASSSVLNTAIGRTGPKISSRMISIVLSTLTSTVGS